MKKNLLYYFIGFVFVIIGCAYLDHIIFGDNTFKGYLLICVWEGLIAILGIVLGYLLSEFKRLKNA